MSITGSDPQGFNFFDALFKLTRQNSVLLMTTDGIITDVNDQFLNSFGYTRKEIIGLENRLLFTKEDQVKGLPERELNNVNTRGQSNDNNYLVNKDGHHTWVSGESVLIFNQLHETLILKIIQNIQEQKNSEVAITELNVLNENILTTIEDVVLVLDSQFMVIKSNRALDGLFKTEHPGDKLNFLALIKPYDRNNDIKEKLQSCFSTPATYTKAEIEAENNSGELKIYNINCAAMNNSSDNRNLLVVIHDITLQKQAQREREDIIGFVAHELRNPLANIVLCNEILNEAIQQNNQQEMVEMLERSKNNVMRLNKMIAELYDATKANAGNLRLDIELFNFRDMINEAVDTVKGLQPFYNIIINGDGNIITAGDKYRLIQVVVNFLSNGIKYSNGNKVVLLEIQPGKDHVTVSVKDEGLGISPNQLPYIFERFFRAEKTKNLEGIGLGLYLCRQIIYAHKGKIWAESVEGKGSTFYFSIPLKQEINN
ncbi:MAG: PAS domain-containing sensor histidine kinase [Bacteroidota bacterium]